MNNMASIISSLIIFLFPYIGRKWFNRYVLSSTVISLGLLGTFGGIMYGLWTFGVEELDDSIPQLLEGLKMAFLTTIAGMSSSILLKLLPSFYGISSDTKAEEDSTENQLIQLFQEIRTNTAHNSEAGLISEIRQLRETNQEALMQLNEHLSRMSQQEMQVNTSLLSESLREIIGNLDHKISENINATLSEIRDLQTKQLECISENQKLNRDLSEYLRHFLKEIEEANKNAELFLSKSTNLNFRQNENLSVQLNNLGTFMKANEEHLQRKLDQIEQKYERELTEMEKFTKTLTLIIQKLAQDHDSLYKQPTQQNN